MHNYTGYPVIRHYQPAPYQSAPVPHLINGANRVIAATSATAFYSPPPTIQTLNDSGFSAHETAPLLSFRPEDQLRILSIIETGPQAGLGKGYDKSTEWKNLDHIYVYFNAYHGVRIPPHILRSMYPGKFATKSPYTPLDQTQTTTQIILDGKDTAKKYLSLQSKQSSSHPLSVPAQPQMRMPTYQAAVPAQPQMRMPTYQAAVPAQPQMRMPTYQTAVPVREVIVIEENPPKYIMNSNDLQKSEFQNQITEAIRSNLASDPRLVQEFIVKNYNILVDLGLIKELMTSMKNSRKRTLPAQSQQPAKAARIEQPLAPVSEEEAAALLYSMRRGLTPPQ